MNAKRKRLRRTTSPIHQRKRRRRSILKIEDIGVDCLQQVFIYLDLKDLLTVANVNQQFRKAAKCSFIGKYSKKMIEIIGKQYGNSGLLYDILDDCKLVLLDFKTILQVLRCFGESISVLDFHYLGFKNVKRFKHIYTVTVHYINEYCADSLKTFKMSPILNVFNMLCAKPFSKVETVEFSICHLNTLCLNRIFPKLQHLHFDWINGNAKFTALAEYFPHLEHLEIDLWQRCPSIELITIERTLQLNQQLRSLKINSVHTISFLKQIKSLEYFEYIGSSESFSKFRGKLLSFPNVNEFKLDLFGRVSEFMSPILRIPFQFDKLKVFFVYSYFQSMHNGYDNFIKRHKSIEKLIFKSIYLTQIELANILKNGFLNKSKLMKSLPSLTEIYLDQYQINFSIVDVVRYMSDFKKLKYFSFYCSSSEDDIKKCCSNNWEVFYLKSTQRNLSYIKLVRNI